MATLTAEQHRRSGFKSLGDFALAVRAAAETKHPDERLTKVYAAAPAAQAQEGDGGSGGYLAPPDVRADVARVVLSETGLLGRTDRVTTTRNSVVMPADASPSWQNLQATVDAEGAGTAQAKLVVQSRVCRLTKLQVTVPCSTELMEDAPGLDAYLRQAVAERLSFRATDYLLNGDGAMKPLGVLQSPALITVTKEAAQPAGTVQAANLSKLWARLWGPSKSRAVFVMHSTVEQAIQGLSLPPGLFTYDENGPRLFGRPCLVSEAAQVIGTPGDIIALDPLGILTAMRPGEVRADVSLHVWYDLGLAAYRFVMRLGAVPWWASTVTQKNGGATVSNAVVLEAR